MLLFLVKYSQPDIANAIRELSKINDKANRAHYRQMLHTVKCVINTKNKMLKLRPEKKDLKWTFTCLCDSDYTGDKDTRLSVTEYCVYVNTCLISWKSRAQESNTLSSTEAEYMVLSEVCCEILFVKQVLEFLGEEMNYLIMVYCDNVGAIFLAYKAKIFNRTKHVDTRIDFVQNYVEDNTIEITYVKSEDNDADVFT